MAHDRRVRLIEHTAKIENVTDLPGAQRLPQDLARLDEQGRTAGVQRREGTAPACVSWAGLFDDLLVGKLKRARESTFPTPAGGVMMMNVKFELCCPISADLGYIRDLVRMYGHRGGLRGERLQDLVLAVNEAVTNVLDHGGAAGLITVRGYTGGFTVEVLDVGGLLTAEQVASARVDPTGSHGFGLWVIQHLCDEVSVARTGLGSVLRLDMRVHSAAAAGRDRHGTHEQRGRRGRHGDQETQPAA